MAKISCCDDGGQKITCDVPSCKKRREERGQENGRYLATVEFNPGTVAVTLICQDCHQTHTIVLPIPLGALDLGDQPAAG